MSHWPAQHAGERGSGTVLTTAAIGVLLVLSVAATQLGAVASAAHRARAAADLSALAAATDLSEGGAAPCTVALELARRNSARLVLCRLEAGESVRVRVVTDVSRAWAGLPATAGAEARAGPAAPGFAGRAAPDGRGPRAVPTRR